MDLFSRISSIQPFLPLYLISNDQPIKKYTIENNQVSKLKTWKNGLERVILWVEHDPVKMECHLKLCLKVTALLNKHFLWKINHSKDK